MPNSRLSIAVAGAGPAGLAAALLLRRAGHSVALFERFERAAPVGSGLILQPTGLAVLHALGLLPAILACGSRIDRIHGADARSGRTVLDVRYAAGPGGRFGLAVHRAALWGVLHEAAAAAGTPIETGCEATDVEAAGGTATLFDPNGRRLGRFDLVVDASGRGSRLRQHVGGREPRPLAYGAFWASLPWPAGGFDPHALSQRYVGASVMIGVLSIGGALPGGAPMAAFFWSLKPADAERVRKEGLDAWKGRVLALWPECAELLAHVTDWDQLTLARYGHATLRRPVGRSYAAIGDAAHSTSPQLGQGANMALLDAAALAHALARHDNLAAALDAYAAARRRHVQLFQALSLVFTPFYQSDSRLIPLVRDRLVATLARVPPMPRLLAAIVSGTLLDPLAAVGLTEPDWTRYPAEDPAPCTPKRDTLTAEP